MGIWGNIGVRGFAPVYLASVTQSVGSLMPVGTLGIFQEHCVKLQEHWRVGGCSSW